MSCLPSISTQKHLVGTSWWALSLTVWLIAASLVGSGEARANPVVKEEFRVYQDLAYGPSLGKPGENTLDVYLPRGQHEGRRPMVVWVHGGGWYQGGKRSFASDKAKIFLRSGFLFASLNYRLSPKVSGNAFPPNRVRHPVAANDSARAVAWLSASAKRFGGDGRRIILMGHSAGGQIISLLGSDPRYLRRAGMNPRKLRGVIALDPVGLDLRALVEGPQVPEEGTSINYRKMIWNAFAAPWEANFDGVINRASPINHADPSDPPFLTVTSSKSALRSKEGIEFARLLGQFPAYGNHNINLSHREISTNFGRSRLEFGTSRRSLRFARWVVFGRQARASVHGKRTFRIKRSRAKARVALRLKGLGGIRWGVCQINQQPAFQCRSRLRLLLPAGNHRLTVQPMNPTGRPGRRTAFRLRVLRPIRR